MAKFEVTVEGVVYEVDAPDENTAWQWANYEHKKTPASPPTTATTETTSMSPTPPMPTDAEAMHGLIGSGVSIVIGIVLFWLVAGRRYKHRNDTPNDVRLWWAGILGGLGFTLMLRSFIGKNIAILWHPSAWDQVLVAQVIVVTVIAFGIGYCIGWVVTTVRGNIDPAKATSAMDTEAIVTRRLMDRTGLPPVVVTQDSPRSSGKPDVNTSVEESLYEQVLTELNTSKRPGLWAIALAQTANGGNPDGAYIALRVEQLRQQEKAKQQQVPTLNDSSGDHATPIDEALAQKRASRKVGWYIHCVIYVVVSVGLALLSVYTGRHPAIIPPSVWGLALLIHGFVVFVAQPGNNLRERLLDRERKRLQG